MLANREIIKVAYFSGTGGTRLVAESIAEALERADRKVEIQNIRKNKQADAGRFGMLFLVFPVHSANAPKTVYRWLNKLKSAYKTKAVIISVSGMGEMFLNTACRTVCKNKLKRQGFDVAYEDMMLMPSNFIIETPEQLASAIVSKSRERAAEIVKAVLRGERREMLPSLIDRVVSLFGRLCQPLCRFFPKLFSISALCDGCKKCELGCEAGNIKCIGQKPVFGKNCDMCMSCYYNCPVRAIRLKHFRFIALKRGYNINKYRTTRRNCHDTAVTAVIKEITDKPVWSGARRYLFGTQDEPEVAKPVSAFLRSFGVILTILIITAVSMMLVQMNGNHVIKPGGYTQEKAADINGEPMRGGAIVRLDGEWEFYPGQVVKAAHEIDLLDRDNAQYVTLPLTKFSQASAQGTYRLRIKLENAPDMLSFYIPPQGDGYNLFYNGLLITQGSYRGSATGRFVLSHIYTEALHSVRYNDSIEYQEIVISIEKGGGNTIFYKSSPYIGSPEAINNYIMAQFEDAMFSIALLIMFLLSGLVFMAIRPLNRFHNLLSLFDTLIGIRVLINTPVVIAIFRKLGLPWITQMPQHGWLQIVLVMSGALFGMFFVSQFTNNKEIYSPLFMQASVILCVVIFIVLAMFPSITETPVHYIIMLFFLTTNIFLLWKTHVYVRQKPSLIVGSMYAHNVFFLITVALDLWQTGAHVISFKMLTYLYMLIFFIHMVWRLLQFNKNYADLHVLNTGLEDMVEKRTSELSRANRMLATLSERDALTGIFNRLYLDQKIEQLFSEYRTSPFPFYLCMFDLDLFKRINDIHGHDEGDEALKDLAATAKRHIGGNSVLARIGGEEFVIILRDMPQQEAINCIETIRAELEANARINPRRTTASFGLVAYTGRESHKELLKSADKCMYESKRNGRNRITICFTNQPSTWGSGGSEAIR